MAKTQKQWTVAGKTGFQDLKLQEDAPIPELGDKDVLVKCELITWHFSSQDTNWCSHSPWRFAQLPRPDHHERTVSIRE